MASKTRKTGMNRQCIIKLKEPGHLHIKTNQNELTFEGLCLRLCCFAEAPMGGMALKVKIAKTTLNGHKEKQPKIDKPSKNT